MIKKYIIFSVIFALILISKSNISPYTVNEINHELGRRAADEKEEYNSKEEKVSLHSRKKVINFPNKFINYFFKENHDLPFDKILKEWKIEDC